MITPHIPIRVFLLSGSRFLGEALGRVLRKASDILVVGACSYSVDAAMGIIESTCDVLLTDSITLLKLDSQIPDNQQCSLSHLKVLVIEMNENESTFSKVARVRVMGYLFKEVAVDDVISAIRVVANGETVCAPRLHMTRCSNEFSTPGHSHP